MFASLFRGREDVYPVRWEDKKGRSGYSPACANEWNRSLCQKPSGKCANCKNRKFLPVTEEVIRDHLQGKHTIGVYPLLAGDRCWFLAIDFDQKNWQEDALVFLEMCEKMEIPGALERSRSGNGAHVWIFFENPLEASFARKLGSVILTLALENRYQIGLGSYDRFFPNQDTLPKGGFGNLIALPLQKNPRQEGNSVFVDKTFRPYDDQWQFMSSLRRVSLDKVKDTVEAASRDNGIIPIRNYLLDEYVDAEPWAQRSAGTPKPSFQGIAPKKIKIILANLVYVEKDPLPGAMINHLLQIAAFQNPEFYKAQAMRLSTFGKPRVIHCADDLPKHIGLPRGCLEDAKAFFAFHDVQIDLKDDRFIGNPIDVSFHGVLRQDQEEAARAILAHENGVLSAPTAFGKTVVASRIIADRKVNSLIIVHRQHLLEHWQEKLSAFLNIPPQKIGFMGGGKKTRTGFIDVALMQTLNRRGQVNDLVKEYGQVIVDECHHLPAFTFEHILKQVMAKYILGLTATPIRRDGHHPIVIMQCGPIRYKNSPHKIPANTTVEHVIIPRNSKFVPPLGFSNPKIHELYAALAADESRNTLIFNDLMGALEEGRSPLLLTERRDHLEYFARRVKKFARNVIVLRGGMGKNQRREAINKIKAIPDGEERLILATGRYIGEGFDDARLDTLFLTLPISWRGTLQQYVGRLHRTQVNKKIIKVYDYVDAEVPMLSRMYEKRLKGYKALGYIISQDDTRQFA
jgi:superfamily II DNA or RNA helicase